MAKAKDSGFTLMELILVIVILGIAAGFTYLSVANVGAAQARSAATDTNYLLSRCRSASLSRAGDTYLKLYLDEDGHVAAEYCEGGVIAEQKQLGNGRVSCSIDGAALTEAGVEISFKRSTGAEDGSIKSIVFAGGRSEYEVYIEPATGSHALS